MDGLSKSSIEVILNALGKRRSFFHSEADFQHEFAWELRRILPEEAKLRLEVPFPLSYKKRKEIDIVVTINGLDFGIELKLATGCPHGKKEYLDSNGESFVIGRHRVDYTSFDCCKDIESLQSLVNSADHRIKRGFLVVLSNCPDSWKRYRRRRDKKVVDSPSFVLFEGRQAEEELTAISPRNDNIKATFRLTERIIWSPYSKLDVSLRNYQETKSLIVAINAT